MSRKLADLLAAGKVAFRRLAHDEAFTAQETARAAHVPGRKMAKVVALRDEHGRWLMAVVPAPCRIDLRALAAASGHHGLRLAAEHELTRRFPDVEPGATPPFERFYHVPVYIDLSFGDANEIYLEDGTHHGLVGLRVQDYLTLARPVEARFATEDHDQC
jgi:Ala-tRNA(Pro) deacylase